MLVITALAVATPAIAWATFKPIRTLAPAFNGITCFERVCVEDPTQFGRAEALQRNAISAVGRKLAPLQSVPITVFCSSRACYHSFGGGMEREATLFNWGVIIPPDSWVPYIVEHEYIHMLQAQQLGLLGRQRTPAWFKEGMPFLVSEPSDHDLPAYARPLVSRYRSWEQRVGHENAWQAAAKLQHPT